MNINDWLSLPLRIAQNIPGFIQLSNGRVRTPSKSSVLATHGSVITNLGPESSVVNTYHTQIVKIHYLCIHQLTYIGMAILFYDSLQSLTGILLTNSMISFCHHHFGGRYTTYFRYKYDVLHGYIIAASFELGLDQLKADETISVASASGGPGAQVYSSMCTRPISIISLLNWLLVGCIVPRATDTWSYHPMLKLHETVIGWVTQQLTLRYIETLLAIAWPGYHVLAWDLLHHIQSHKLLVGASVSHFRPIARIFRRGVTYMGIQYACMHALACKTRVCSPGKFRN